MGTFAAVMTGKQAAAIATIELHGDRAEAVLRGIFRPAGTRPPEFGIGTILLGTIVDGGRTIDQVTIGCEGPAAFAINCHGNPLIIEMIMELLGRNDVTLLSARELLARILSGDESLSTIAVESRLAQLDAKTLEGTEILANQVESGLTKALTDRLADIESIPLSDIASGAAQVLDDSRTAGLIIFGCTAVLAGPPNSGKSTLLNCLSGRNKAIVADIRGATRDWVSASCKIGPLVIEMIDTAGLDNNPSDDVDRAARRKTEEMIQQADLILFVLDASLPANQLDGLPLGLLADKMVVTVLNKCDLPVRLDTKELPPELGEPVRISAARDTGIDDLRCAILRAARCDRFDPKTPICFTPRQKHLLEDLSRTASKDHTRKTLNRLLNDSDQA